MTLRFLLFLFFILYFPITQIHSQNNHLSGFKWMLGEWQRTNVKSSQIAMEKWYRISDERLEGIGLTIENGDTLFIEYLTLTYDKGKVLYSSEVEHNPAPVYFEVTELKASGFVCENSRHDFPKKITYRYRGDQMTAIISGDGKSIPFHFKRVMD